MLNFQVSGSLKRQYQQFSIDGVLSFDNVEWNLGHYLELGRLRVLLESSGIKPEFDSFNEKKR